MFYKGRGTWVDKAIRWWTKSDFSHVELDCGPYGSFSSSIRDGGVRFKEIDYIPGHWVPVDVYVPDTSSLIAFCRSVSGKKYGLWDVFRFVVPWWRNKKDEWFCSEVVLRALQEGGRFKGYDPSRVSPGDLYELVRHKK